MGLNTVSRAIGEHLNHYANAPRIWIRVTDSISYDDNLYFKCAPILLYTIYYNISIVYIYIYI